MTKNKDFEGVFTLPSTTNKAGQVFYATMLSGVVFVPMLLVIYHRFIEVRGMLSMKEVFLMFTVVHILFFSFCTGRATSASTKLRKYFDKTLPRNAVIVAPAAANSGNSEIVEWGKKYWFWQLTSSFLTGVTFSWLGCIFILFIA